MVTLVIRGRDGTQTAVQVSERPVTLGRAESCDVVLRHDAEVSREHAQVWLDERGHVLVADLNSKNGTRVDIGEPFRSETRPAFSHIRIGEHDIMIRGAPPRDPTASTSVTFIPDPPERAGQTHFFPSSKGLDLNQQRLALLMSLTTRIGGAFERKQLLEQALDACCEALQFERGLVVLKTPRGEPDQPITRNVDRDESGAYRISRTLINRALIHGERAVVNNPATDLAGNLTESMVRFPICSALCVPILHREEILGAIYGDRVTHAATYTPEDVDFLAAIAQQVGVGLANLRLLRDYVRLQQVEVELNAARKIQRELLPAAPLQVGRLLIDGYNEPSATVGGDYFDYFPLGDARAGFVIADVTGHGLAAALVMANYQAAIQVALTTDDSLPDIAARLNRLVCRNTASDVFITSVLGTVDAATGLLEFVNAGHPGPVLAGTDRPPPGEERGSLPFGIEPQEQYVLQRIEPGSHAGVMLFYTDGLTEAVGPGGERLGTAAVKCALADLAPPTTESALRTALSAVRQHRAGGKSHDDLTLLAIQIESA